MSHTITVKYESAALKANEMRFGLHAMATITERSDTSASVFGSVAMDIGHEYLCTPLRVGFSLPTTEARALAAAIIRYADLADAKCAELALGEAA